MEDTSTGIQKHKFDCVLRCKDAKCFYRFPRNDEARKTWLERIGLRALQRGIGLARICSNHFSERMFSERGKRLTSCAVPDKNIPGMVINKATDENPQVIKPRQPCNYINLKKIPQTVQEVEIITHRKSRCFLKCKDAEVTFGFPHDQISLDIWAKQLGFDRMPPRTSTARICKNHFSARMFTSGKGRRLTSCAIPDINLPGQIIFRSEEEVTSRTANRSNAMNQKITQIDKTVSVSETVMSQDNNGISAMLRPVLEQPAAVSNCKPPDRALMFNNSAEANSIHSYHLGEGIKFDNEIEELLPENENINLDCVFKCSRDGRIFEFPYMEAQRKLWLKQVGLKQCSSNIRICERHFSERMFVKSKRMLAKFAFPDINMPVASQARKKKDSSKDLNEYGVVLHDKHTSELKELPAFIYVNTVLKKAKIENGLKYVQHNVNKNVPKRERGVQVDVLDLISTVDVAIPGDSDSVDEFQCIENIEHQPLNWNNMFDSHVFNSKSMYECVICGEISIGRDNDLKHSNLHKETGVLCSQCGKLFSSQYKLMMHERDKHLKNLRKVFRCPKIHCKKAFHSRKLLHHHVDKHANFTEFRCKKCRRLFKTSLKLRWHRISGRKCWSLKNYKINQI